MRVMDLGRSGFDGMNKPALGIDANMGFQAEIPLVGLFVWLMSGSRLLALFLVEDAAEIRAAPIIEPPRIIRDRPRR